MAGKEIRAGGAFVEIYLKGKETLFKGLDETAAKLQSVSRVTGMIGGALTGVSAAVLAPLGAAFSSFMAQGDKLSDTAARIGITTDRLQELSFAASQSGASMEDVERAMLEAQKRGLDFEKTAAEIGKITDPAERNRAAFEAFGKAGLKIAPMLAELPALSAKAHDLGIVRDAGDVAAAGELADMWGILTEQAAVLAFTVGGALAPVMKQVFEVLMGAMKATIDFVSANRELVVGIAAGALIVGALGVAFLTVSAICAGLAVAITVAGSALGFILSPIGAVTLAVVAIGAALVAGVAYWFMYTQSGQEAASYIAKSLQQIWEFTTKVLGGIFNAVAAGNLQLAWEIALAGVFVVFTKFREKLVAAWESMKTQLVHSTVGMLSTLNSVLPKAMQTPQVLLNAAVAGRAMEENRANATSKGLTGVAEAALDRLTKKAAAEREEKGFEFKMPEMPDLQDFEKLEELSNVANKAATSWTGQAGFFQNAHLAGVSGQLTNEVERDKKKVEILEGVLDELKPIRKAAEDRGLVFV